ncbi:hypothetical protein [Pseudooceanicola sp. MF1-13]|uniref:hypothetical protein n=1 Tax=Pseudooceanicola sp. MF1-13 TaxID=3379095 RepID=UPI0038925739
MTTFLRRFASAATLIAGISAASSSMAASVPQCNGESSSFVFSGGSQGSIFRAGLAAGETASFQYSGNFLEANITVSGPVQPTFLCTDQQSCDGLTYTATQAGNYTFTIYGTTQGRSQDEGQLQLTANPPTLNTVTASCTPASTGTDDDAEAKKTSDAQSGASKAAGATSTTAVNTAINSALNGGPGIVATQNGVFFSTQGQNSDTTFWGAFQGRKFDGTITGRNLEFTLGGDVTLAETTRLGLFVSKGKADLTIGGVSVTADALSIGPYFRAGIGQSYDITGFALFAKPDYNVGGTTYKATRRAFGLQANATYALSGTEINSWLGVRGFSEDHPAAGALAAKSIRDVTASIGTKAVFGQDALRPYLSVAAEYHNNVDGGVRDTFFSPRLGMGFSYTAGRGQLNVDLDGGKVLSNTRDYGINIGYSLNF